MELDTIQLHQAMSLAFDDIGDFKILLQTIKVEGRSFKWSDFAGDTTTLPECISNVIAKAQAQGWTVALLNAISESAYKNNPGILDFFAKHPECDPAQAPVVPPNPFITNFLVANRPFVGRQTLRKHLPSVGQGNQSRNLLVDGARKSGKTYTNAFLQFLAPHRNWRIRYLDLDTQSFTLDRFTTRLKEELMLPDVPEKNNEQDARWAERLADWVLRNSVDHVTGSSFWLVLDGFQTQEHEQGVHEFVGKLAEMIDITATSQAGHFRLVLINYGARMPAHVKASALEEAIDPPKKSEFQDSFVRSCCDRGMTQVAAVAAFDQVYAQAVEMSESDPEGAVALLFWLNIGVTKAMKALNK